MTHPTVISLFTGAGGLDLGFEAAGFRTAIALEIDGRCCATLRHNRDWPVIEDDINSVSTSSLLEAGGLAAGEADVLIGGPPCQPFSKSGFWATGDAKRLSDPRASTLEGYLRVLAESRPRAFLLENVEGLGFKGKDEGLRLINGRLAAINAFHGTQYRAAIKTLNAADYGVPQLRKRIFVVGSRDGTVFDFPEPTHANSHVTSWEALGDLPEPNDPETTARGKWADLLPTIPEGENYLWHTDRGGGEPLFGWRRRYWSFLLKLAKHQPSWTIQAQPGPATGPFHWRNRRLTMREMARLQTLPENVQVLGSISDVQRQLGNAVPSLLAEVLARNIARSLLKIDLNLEPILSVRRCSVPAPAPEQTTPVPERYLSLRGKHEPHPGTGRGLRAIERNSEATLLAAE